MAQEVLIALFVAGVREILLSPSSRNAPFVDLLTCSKKFHIYTCPEERSAAFFAVGRIMTTRRPVAIFTTSGTAAAELLPATMEAFYGSLPLVLVTADRPRRFRGTGAPQSALQEKLFGPYTPHAEDLETTDSCHLHLWDQKHPAHLNVCLEEPEKFPLDEESSIDAALDLFAQGKMEDRSAIFSFTTKSGPEKILAFLQQSAFPFAIVGALTASMRPFVRQFLLNAQLPVYLESLSGLREDPLLAPFAIRNVQTWQSQSAQASYPIDGVLRLGGVPTARLWRDLEDLEIPLLSVSEFPFSGIFRGEFLQMEYAMLPLLQYPLRGEKWLTKDQECQQRLQELFAEEPLAEPSLIRKISQHIAPKAHVYLGNSLPIREWDLAAVYEAKELSFFANRGVNGIDGQISSFLGVSADQKENWGLIGDLTALYDFSGLWLAGQLSPRHLSLVIINNKGGKIFQRLFANPLFQNNHHLSFAPYADFWGWEYVQWDGRLSLSHINEEMFRPKLLEVLPCHAASERFWQKLNLIQTP